MTQKKYEFTGETKKHFGRTLHQIKSLVAIASIGVSIGDLGGWIESERNLTHSGNAWVYGNARVSGNARVYGNAEVSGDAWVYGNAEVSGNARVYGDAEVIWISHVGSESGTLTLFRTKDGALVNRGCFTGTLDEFEAAVRERHTDSLHAQEYLLIVQLMRLRVASWPTREVSEDGADAA